MGTERLVRRILAPATVLLLSIITILIIPELQLFFCPQRRARRPGSSQPRGNGHGAPGAPHPGAAQPPRSGADARAHFRHGQLPHGTPQEPRQRCVQVGVGWVTRTGVCSGLEGEMG